MKFRVRKVINKTARCERSTVLRRIKTGLAVDAGLLNELVVGTEIISVLKTYKFTIMVLIHIIT